VHEVIWSSLAHGAAFNLKQNRQCLRHLPAISTIPVVVAALFGRKFPKKMIGLTVMLSKV